jgi:hypothetical protein
VTFAQSTLHRPRPHALARVLAVFGALHGIAHLAGSSDAFSKAAHAMTVDYLSGPRWSVWSSTSGSSSSPDARAPFDLARSVGDARVDVR